MALDFPNSPSTGQTFQGLSWDGTKWVGTTQQNIAPAYNNVGRNLLHNSLFNISQRAGPWSYATNTTYTLDRWVVYSSHTGTSYTVTQIALVDADRTAIGDEAATRALQYLFTNNATAADFDDMAQAVEGVRRLAGKTVTISFWAKAAAGTPKVGVGIYQSFGTGGSPSAGVTINATPVTLSTTWVRYSVTIAVPSAAGKTLGTSGDNTEIDFYLSAGSSTNTAAGGIGVQSGTVTFWGIQLEIGSVATPLEKPDPQQDLAKCQRFYEVFAITNDYASAPTGITSMYRAYKFATTKRAIPSITFSNFIYYSAGVNTAFTPTTVGITADMVTAVGTGLTNANGFVSGTIAASADL